MSSLPTIESANLDAYWDIVRSFDPDWYMVRVKAQEYKIQPYIIDRMMRALFNITTRAHGTGYGKVQIFIENNVVSHIKPEESDKINLPVFEDEEGNE